MTINVGEGGEGGVAASGTTTDGLAGGNGGNSYFKVGDVTYITACGGGGDGGYASTGVACGGSNSGSRGTHRNSGVSVTATALNESAYIGEGADVANVVCLRNKGSEGYVTDSGASGGAGGGAVAAGKVASGSGAGGTGGAGFESDITGVSAVYGSGGGGGLGKSVSGGALVGKAGVGAGAGYADEKGGDALANQGGGGGGGSCGMGGGDGGSGIVVLRFAYSEEDIVVDAEVNVKSKISSKAYTGSALASGIVDTYAYQVSELTNDLVNVGKKAVRVTLNDGYVWSDGNTNKSKDFDWYIAAVEPMANGYTVTGLGEKGNEVAVVFTNHTAAINWTVPADLKNVEFLVVGGGGGGGSDNAGNGDNENYEGGGGGGGGGVVTGLVNLVKNQSVAIKIGAGGIGGIRGNNSAPHGGVEVQAENSFFSVEGTVVTANAGGGDPGSTKCSGVGGAQTGGDGGSSSGTRSSASGRGKATCGQVDNPNGLIVCYAALGNQGGAGASSNQGGGGGGATEEGAAGTSAIGGKGGEGLPSDLTGTLLVYGSGGGGGAVASNADGVSLGGTGAGNGGHKVAATSALANQGGGGGGGGRTGNGGNGGSGIVVFRYVLPSVLPKVDGVEVEPGDVLNTARVSKPIWYPAEAEITVKDGVTTITYEDSVVEVPEYYAVTSAPVDEGGYTVTLTLNDLAIPRIANKVAGGEVETPAISIEGDKVKIHLEGTYSTLYYTLETSEKIGESESWAKAEGDWSDDKSGFTFTITDGEKTPSRFFRVGKTSDEATSNE